MSETRIEWGNKVRYPGKDWYVFEREDEEDARNFVHIYGLCGREAKVVSRVVKVSDWVEY